MSDLLIQNCHVVQCENNQVQILRNHDLLLHDNLIKDLKPSGIIGPEFCDRILNARGMVAMPGLINTHAHVPMVIFRGLAEDVNLETWFNEFMWPLESNLEPEDVYWGMLLGLVEMIENGVTAVADHYFYMDIAASAVEKAGTRAALGWAVFGNQGLTMLDKTAHFVERFQGAAQGRITTWLAPHAPYTCSEDFLRSTATWARKLNAGIHIHVSETKAQTETSLTKTGLTPIQILERTGILEHPTILAHACGVTEQDIRLLSDYKCGIAHAPKTYLKLAMGVAPVSTLIHTDIAVGLATDGAVSNNTLDIWESMRLMALIQKHETGQPENLTIGETMTIATRGSARVFHLPDRIGHLAPGYLADLILVDMSGAHNQPLHSISANLVYATRATDVQTVLVNGNVIMQDRQLLTLNKKEIIEQVNQSMDRLAQRVPNHRIQVYNP